MICGDDNRAIAKLGLGLLTLFEKLRYCPKTGQSRREESSLVIPNNDEQHRMARFWAQCGFSDIVDRP